jgi:putative transposase
MINSQYSLPVIRQCQLLDLPRSSFYYQEALVDPRDLELMRVIDKMHLDHPFYGSRKILCELRKLGFDVGRDKVVRMRRKMGIEVIYRKPRTSIPKPFSKIYPYLLKDLSIVRVNQVWSTDITYIPMAKGFSYLIAIIDLLSRKVLSWRLSNTLDTSFCTEALEDAISNFGTPDIFNTDQGCQFTSDDFTDILKDHKITISMDGKGRWIDNVFIERLWRSVKYEEVYLKAYETMNDARVSLAAYFTFYNENRPHQTLDYKTPDEVYYERPQIFEAA